MKKWLLAIGLILVLSVIAVYLFIPSKLIISEAAIVNCSMPAAKRFLFEENNWRSWINADSLAETGTRHQVINTFFTKTDVVISNDEDEYTTTLRLLPFNIDSSGIEWGDTLYTGNNPFTRIRQYNKARKLKEKMDFVMTRMTEFLNDKSRIYSINVFKEQLKDAPLLSKRVVMNRKPTAEDAYKLIDEVKQQALQQGDGAIGPAMKYSSSIDTGNYELMVAIPTKRMLKSNNNVTAKGLVGGNLIVTEVRGGEWTINKAWENIRQYKEDYKISSPAIPFETLITDRPSEPDTSKWITRIYYPTRQ